MAGIETYKIPITYKNESEYISPAEVIDDATQAKIDRIKARKIGGIALLKW